jgi:hypothetical protein
MENYKKQYFNYKTLMQEGPEFSTANSVLNADKTIVPTEKVNKTKDSQPTTGEKGEVAQQNEKSHRDVVKGVFGEAHDARIPSGNTGQLKFRSQVSVPEQKALVQLEQTQ